MFGLKTRILAGVILSAAVAIVAGGPALDAAQKSSEKPSPSKKKDATKRAVGTLPADAKFDFAKLAAHIDKLIEKKLKEEKTTASDVCTDEEFFRRVTIDITGKIAPAEKAAAFLDSKDANKRAKLIDELLANKEYGKHMADVWQAMLLPRDSDAVRFRQYANNMTTWLEKQFNDNPGWDKTVKELLTSTGDVSKEGPAVYWVINATPDKMTDNVTRMFMGVQLQCAQCHNHPFTDYKQAEYWHMAAFFFKVGPEGNAKAAAKNKTGVNISEKGKGVNKKRLGPDAKILPPKFLQDESPKVKNNDALRPLLADWMATKKNPYFGKAMANRMWGHFMGRGIVAPVDDMHDANPASHPELLMDLAAQFAANDFDVKYLVRAICNSTTYQRSSKAKGDNAEAGPELFARMAVKPLTPGQMWDSVQVLVGSAPERPGKQAKGGNRNVGNARQQFVVSFGIEDGADPTEFQTGIPQALRLMNSPQLNNAGLLAPILKNSKSQDQMIEKLYLAVLNRRPSAEEIATANKYITKSRSTQREALAGVMWAMMSSSEFALNR